MSARITVRLRLTLVYGAVFFVGGVVLVGAAILLARHYVGPVRTNVVDGGGPPAGLIPQRRLTDDAWRRTVDELALMLGLLTLAALGAGWLAAGRALRPLRELSDRARRLAGDAATDGRGDELDGLRLELDAVRERLDRAHAGYRRFMADASHELLTPLAVMRAGIEVSLNDPEASEEEVRATTETLRESIERSDHVVRGLLALAQSEAPAIRSTVELDAEVASAIHEVSEEIEARGLELRARVARARVLGDPALLRALVSNLLRNALLYNRPRGWIELDVASDGGNAVLRVANSGEVVLEEEVESLFEPFKRRASPGSPRGAGLGLAIVHSIAEGHGGAVEAHANQLGGLELKVTLPLADARADGGAHGSRRGARERVAGILRRTLLVGVLTAGLVGASVGALTLASAGARAVAKHESDAEAARGARAFPLAWTGMSAANLVRIAGRPSWQGASSVCFRRGFGALFLTQCANGDHCLQYGDVESNTSTGFCFHHGLLSKHRWTRAEWSGLVDSRTAGTAN